MKISSPFFLFFLNKRKGSSLQFLTKIFSWVPILQFLRASRGRFSGMVPHTGHILNFGLNKITLRRGKEIDTETCETIPLSCLRRLNMIHDFLRDTKHTPTHLPTISNYNFTFLIITLHFSGFTAK